MQTSDVRKQVLAAIERAKRSAVERRGKSDEASRAFEGFLQNVAVPMFRQIAGALKPEGYSFQVFTPGGSVRLMSDRSSEDYIEIALDTTGKDPAVIGHTSRGRGRRVVESERVIPSSAPGVVEEDVLLDYLVSELEAFVER